MIVLGVLFLVGCVQTEPVEEHIVACTLEYAPVCGVDNVTYGNACSANASNVEIAYVGECNGNTMGEVTMCPAIYAPVCGVDGVTYGNECAAGDVEIAYEGECMSENRSNFTQACTREYMPVCGVDGVTYGNTCMAEASGVEIAYTGECGLAQSEPVVTYENGVLEYSFEVQKPTPCHSVEVEEIVMESFPVQIRIDAQIVSPSEDVMCSQVISPETITGSFQTEQFESVEIFVNGENIYTTIVE